MPTFLLRAVQREADGTLGPTLCEEPIEAPDQPAAIAAARAIDMDMAALGANAVYLTAEDGRAVWSLHAMPSAIETDEA